MNLVVRKKCLENSRIFYLLIILACMNFFEHGALIILIFGVFFLFKSEFRFEIDGAFVSLFVMTGCVIVTSFIYDSAFVECLKALNYILLYIVGRRGYTLADNKELFIKRTIFSVFLGFFIQLVLHYAFNYGKTFEHTRMMYSIWTKQPIAVTLIGLLSAAIIGYSFYGVFLCKKFYIKLLCIAAIILTLVVNLRTATRTPIFLMFADFIAMAFIYFSDNSSNISKRKLRLLGVLLVLVVSGFIAYETDAFNFKSYVESSALMGRVLDVGMKTGRTTLLTQFNELMPYYPWGGGHIREIVGRSAHNYLQESYDLYGVFSFVALIFFTIHMIINLFRLLKIKGKRDFHYLIISVGITLFIQCCLEPVVTGYPVSLWTLIMIDGMTTSYLNSKVVSLEVLTY